MESRRSLKMLFVSNLYPPLVLGGYEQICHDVAEGLRLKGHDVHVLTSAFRTVQNCEPEKQTYRLLKLETNWNLADAATPWVGRHRLETEWNNSRTMRRVLARCRPDIVVFWNGSNLGRSLISAAERQVPVIYYVSDGWLAPALLAASTRRTRPVLRKMRNQLLRFAGMDIEEIDPEWLIFCSNSLRNDYENGHTQLGRASVIHHGVSTDWFLPTLRRLPAPNAIQPHRILFSGRICPEKGVATLIRAVARLHSLSGFEKSRLSILGIAQDKNYLQGVFNLVRQVGLEDAVDFLEPRPRRDIASVYAEHDLLVFPSEWAEPFSLTLLEAMAAGLPIVSTLTGGSTEILKPGANCVSFEPGNVDSLVHAMAWALRHPDEMAALAVTAREEVREGYTLDRQIALVETLCQQVWDHRKGSLHGGRRRDRTGNGPSRGQVQAITPSRHALPAGASRGLVPAIAPEARDESASRDPT